MAYDPNQQYQQPPQYPPPGQQGYQQQPGYPPPGYQPPGAQKSLMVQQLGPSSIGIDPNIAAALSYFWIIGLIFFLIEKQNKFVRFHALQGLFYGVGFAIVATILNILSSHVFFLLGCLGGLLWLVWVVGAIYAAVQAYNGKWFQLPVVGSMAYNNAMTWNPAGAGGPGPQGGGYPPNTQYPPQQPGGYPPSGQYPPQQPPGQWPQQ
jgi:uncharacterized membrane protein